MRGTSSVWFVVCVTLWACAGEVATRETAERDTGRTTTPTPGVEATMTIAENPNNTLSALVTVETPEEATVAIAFSSVETAEQLTGTNALGTTHEFVVVGMRHKTVYTFEPVVTYASGVTGRVEGATFETGREPSGLPDMTVTVVDADAVQEGITIIGPAGEGGAEAPEFVGLDVEGEVVWYYDAPDESWQSPDRDLKLMTDGNLLLKTQDGLRVINLAGDTLVDIRSSDMGYGMHHDVTVLPNGNFMALVQQEREVEVEALGGLIRQVGDGLLEITPEGEVVWEWWTFDHLDTDRFPTQLSLDSDRGRYDWTHANSAAYRASDASTSCPSVIKTGDQGRPRHGCCGLARRRRRRPRLAGRPVVLRSAQRVPWEDGRLSVYDNGNERASGEQFSRGVVYQLDESAMTAQEVFSYDVGMFTPFIGGHRILLNGNSLLCAGGVSKENRRSMRSLRRRRACVAARGGGQRTVSSTTATQFLARGCRAVGSRSRPVSRYRYGGVLHHEPPHGSSSIEASPEKTRCWEGDRCRFVGALPDRIFRARTGLVEPQVSAGPAVAPQPLTVVGAPASSAGGSKFHVSQHDVTSGSSSSRGCCGDRSRRPPLGADTHRSRCSHRGRCTSPARRGCRGLCRPLRPLRARRSSTVLRHERCRPP